MSSGLDLGCTDANYCFRITASMGGGDKDDVGFPWSSELLLLPLFKLRLNEGMMGVMQKGFRYQTETELTHPQGPFCF